MKETALNNLNEQTINNDSFDPKYNYLSKVIEVKRTVKVTKGGKQQHFRVIVLIGDKNSRINIGVASATTIPNAIQKALTQGHKAFFTFPISLFLTKPYCYYFKYGATKLFIQSKLTKTYSHTNSIFYTFLDFTGLSHLHVKQLGSKNILNNLKALLLALLKLKEYLSKTTTKALV